MLTRVFVLFIYIVMHSMSIFQELFKTSIKFEGTVLYFQLLSEGETMIVDGQSNN